MTCRHPNKKIDYLIKELQKNSLKPYMMLKNWRYQMIKLQPEHNPYAASRAGTVGDLIEILKDYDPDKIVISTNPPFDHVNIEPQIDGTILISS